MVKQKSTILIASMVCSSLGYATSKTMFIPRLITTDQVFELGLTNYQFHRNKNESTTKISVKPFYQNSHAAHSLAKFFLPNKKTSVTLREDGTGDINPLWLNLISPAHTSYASTLSLKPKRTSTGAVLTWYSDLSSYVNHLWLGINTAIVHTKHNLHLQESNSANPGTLAGFTNACDAFNNSDWSAGRLSCCSQTLTRLDDIQIKIGYDCIDTNDVQISPYAVGTIPTGKRPKARYLFEPLVGSKHGSLGFGLNADFTLCSNLSFMADAKYAYAFASSERRSFDLNNGDWSRYLLVVTQAEPFTTFPGINSFTKKVRVTPGNTFQLWSALHYQDTSWHYELGYNFWLRGKEKIRIKSCSIHAECSQTPIGIFDMIRACNASATTAHTAQISQSIVGTNLVVSDTQFTPTRIEDLNICSAANSRVLSNTLYGSCGYQCASAPVLLALHGSYEFTNSYGAINQYALWGTFEIQF